LRRFDHGHTAHGAASSGVSVGNWSRWKVRSDPERPSAATIRAAAAKRKASEKPVRVSVAGRASLVWWIHHGYRNPFATPPGG